MSGGFFTQQTQTVVIDEENSVVIRKATFKERQQFIGRNMNISLNDAGKPGIAMDSGGLVAGMMAVCIVSWSGPGFEGRPVTPENIELLPVDVADRIAAAVDKFNEGHRADEKKV